MTPTPLRTSHDASDSYPTTERVTTLLQMPDADYRALPGLGSGAVKALTKSYDHLLAYQQEPHEYTPSRRFGALVDCLLTCPETWGAFVVEIDEGRAKPNERKSIESGGRCVAVKPSEIATARAAHAALLRHPEVQKWLRRDDLEWQATVHEDIGGVPCKGRLDLWIPGLLIDVSLKTCGSATPDGFRMEARRNLYPLQEAHYCTQIERCLGLEPNSVMCLWLAVEGEPPHGVRIFRMPPEMRLAANAQCDAAYANYQTGLAGFTGYPTDIVDLGFSQWDFAGE